MSVNSYQLKELKELKEWESNQKKIFSDTNCDHAHNTLIYFYLGTGR